MATDKIKIKRTIEYKGPNKRDHFLADLFKKIQPTVGCEVGVRNGRTTFHLLNAFPNLKMFCFVGKDKKMNRSTTHMHLFKNEEFCF